MNPQPLPTLTLDEVKGKLVAGIWRQMPNGSLRILPFGGQWREPKSPSLGPGDLLVASGVLYARAQQ
jgi:hypothetical protein